MRALEPISGTASAGRATPGTVLTNVWDRSRQTHLKRVAVIERAYQALANGALPPELRRQAEREAHELAEGLSSFGLAAASEAASHIEQFWRAEVSSAHSGRRKRQDVWKLLAPLRRELGCELPGSLREPARRARRARTRPAAAQPAVVAVQVTAAVDIVLVDSDAGESELLMQRLVALGFAVRRFGDGESALDALAGLSPALTARVMLLGDIGQGGAPGLDAFALVRRLGSEGLLERQRVIMLSAAAGSASIARAIDAGVHGYMARPYRWSTLVAHIDESLAGTPPLFVLGPMATTSRGASIITFQTRALARAA